MPVLLLALLSPVLALAAPQEARPPGLHRNTDQAFPGLTLIAPLNSRFVYLLDMEGEVAHHWETGSVPTGAVYLQEDGTLLRAGRKEESKRFFGGGMGGLLEQLGWDGTVLWRYELANEVMHQHHDLEPLPNGNLLVIAWEYHGREQAVARGRDPFKIDANGLWPDVVRELRPIPPDGAEVVWEWHAWDHLVQDRNPEGEEYGSVAESPGRIDINADHRDRPAMTEEERLRQEELEEQMRALGYLAGDDDTGPPRGMRAPDWLHCNAIDYHPGQDLILLCTPHLNELWVIDHSTTTEEARGSTGGRWGKGGDLLWRWGNPRVYGAGTDQDQRLWYQHDARWLFDPDEDALRVLVFNNGGDRPAGPHSSVEELLVPFDPDEGFALRPGVPAGPEDLAWSYADPPGFFSRFVSGAQRLPNGNTLICEGVFGRVFEVTAAGEIVWEWVNPYGGGDAPGDARGDAPPKALFRATRIPREHPGLRELSGADGG